MLYFGRAIAANIGIVASSLVLPNYGWIGCFVFFGVLTVVSFVLLLIFNEKPLPVTKSLREARGGTTPLTT